MGVLESADLIPKGCLPCMHGGGSGCDASTYQRTDHPRGYVGCGGDSGSVDVISSHDTSLCDRMPSSDSAVAFDCPASNSGPCGHVCGGGDSGSVDVTRFLQWAHATSFWTVRKASVAEQTFERRCEESKNELFDDLFVGALAGKQDNQIKTPAADNLKMGALCGGAHDYDSGSGSSDSPLSSSGLRALLAREQEGSTQSREHRVAQSGLVAPTSLLARFRHHPAIVFEGPNNPADVNVAGNNQIASSSQEGATTHSSSLVSPRVIENGELDHPSESSDDKSRQAGKHPRIDEPAQSGHNDTRIEIPMSVKHGIMRSQEGMRSRTHPAISHLYAWKCELNCTIDCHVVKSSQAGMQSDTSPMSGGAGSVSSTEPFVPTGQQEEGNAPVGDDLQLVEVTLHQTASPKPTPDLVVKLPTGPVMCLDLRKAVAHQRKVALQRVCGRAGR